MDKCMLDTDVLTEARKRVKKMLIQSDEVYVSFSGGKDSLVVLELIGEQIKDKKINVIFMDEEMIPTEVFNFVQEKMKDDRYNFIYIATQMESDITILGKCERYVQWDKKRKHVREKPSYAIEFNGVVKQTEIEKYIFNGTRKNIGIAMGVRADESQIRRMSFLNRKEPYKRKGGLKNISVFNPIYDWSEKDVFKYFYDKKIVYCGSYDTQLFSKQGFRVSTVLHSEASRHLKALKQTDSYLYNQIMQIFPQIELQVRYMGDVSAPSARRRTIEKYRLESKSPVGAIHLYIERNLTGLKKKQAQKTLLGCKKQREHQFKLGKYGEFGGFPYYYVFDSIIKGNIKRMVLPIKSEKDQNNKDNYIFEGKPWNGK